MVEYLDGIGVRFWHSTTVVDYHPEIPGSARGRALEPQTFDGRRLGKADFGRVRRPVAVNAAGRRFVDESVSYHRFTRAMYDSDKSVPTVPAWLVIDAAALRRYGLGMIRPHTPAPLLRKLRDAGYLRQAATVRELAASIGVDPDGLERTVRDTNRFARTGVDEEFGKGTSVFGHQYGDPEHTPNINLGPIETAPFSAIAVVPTPLGTALGMRTDPSARVLDEAGAPIPGLYACGNDAQSVMASEYPGAGCQVGAGLTFGYVAARHAAGS